MIRYITTLIFLFIFQSIDAQILTQTIRGSVTDKIVKTPLNGATIIIQNNNYQKLSITDTEGNFKIENVEVGNYTIQINYIGYKPIVLSNINLGSGKEVVLTIEMDQTIISSKEIIITSKKRKDESI